jgi:rod shape-determining protein MreC
MRNLLQILAKYHRLILFILLEGVAISLIVNSNNYHNTRVLKGIRKATLVWEGIVTDVRNYFRIKKINEDLQTENTALKNILLKYKNLPDSVLFLFTDTTSESVYEFYPATVVNNSVNRQKNYFTIDRGKKHGVDVNMAVVSPWGVAGITVASSDNFSVVMPVINIDFKLSSKIKSNDYFGSLTWDGRNCNYALLNDIPQHVILNTGDTVVTTGYSSIFPGNIMVGIISEFEKSGSDFYRIRVHLATEFRRLTYVNVIKNRNRDEQVILERGFQ